jgi:hypothetical protein
MHLYWDGIIYVLCILGKPIPFVRFGLTLNNFISNDNGQHRSYRIPSGMSFPFQLGFADILVESEYAESIDT